MDETEGTLPWQQLCHFSTCIKSLAGGGANAFLAIVRLFLSPCSQAKIVTLEHSKLNKFTSQWELSGDTMRRDLFSPCLCSSGQPSHKVLPLLLSFDLLSPHTHTQPLPLQLRGYQVQYNKKQQSSHKTACNLFTSHWKPSAEIKNNTWQCIAGPI